MVSLWIFPAPSVIIGARPLMWSGTISSTTDGRPSTQHDVVLRMEGSLPARGPPSPVLSRVGSATHSVHPVMIVDEGGVSGRVLTLHRASRPPSDLPPRRIGNPFRLPLRDGKYISRQVMFSGCSIALGDRK